MKTNDEKNLIRPAWTGGDTSLVIVCECGDHVHDVKVCGDDVHDVILVCRNHVQLHTITNCEI